MSRRGLLPLAPACWPPPPPPPPPFVPPAVLCGPSPAVRGTSLADHLSKDDSSTIGAIVLPWKYTIQVQHRLWRGFDVHPVERLASQQC